MQTISPTLKTSGYNYICLSLPTVLNIISLFDKLIVIHEYKVQLLHNSTNDDTNMEQTPWI